MAAQPGPARVDPLSISGIGDAAASFLTSTGGWTSRHVEHFEFIDETSARRRVTVDLRLSKASTVAVGQASVYFVPVAVIAKEDPVDHVDLRDEGGAALPLLTRQENAALSEAAICTAARLMAGQAIGDEVEKRLRRIAWELPAVAGEADRQPPETDEGRIVTTRLVEHELEPDEPTATDELQPLHVGSAQAPVEGSDQLFGTKVSEPGEEILDVPALTA